MTLSALMAIALPTVMLTGCGKDKSAQAEGEPTVKVAVPEVDSVMLHKTYPGYIRAASHAEVVCLVNGKLLTQTYEDGDYVNKGQVLFSIDPSTYQDAVRQAQASLAEAESQASYYTHQYAAMTKALEADAVSEMEMLQAKASLEQAKASVENARAALATARTNLSHCTITAPISGHISASTLSLGSYISGEGQPVKLATIYSDMEMKAVFEIEDAQYHLLGVAKGKDSEAMYSKIPLVFDPPMPVAFTADLYYTSPAVNTGTGTLTLEGKVVNQRNLLRDGMFVSVDLPYGAEPEALLIRDTSIGRDQLGSYVYVVNDSNKVVYTPIEIGELYRDSLRIVNKGLTKDSRYVTDALLTVRNGETVKPVQ